MHRCWRPEVNTKSPATPGSRPVPGTQPALFHAARKSLHREKDFTGKGVIPADFEGNFRVLRNPDGEWMTICTLPLERYVASVTAKRDESTGAYRGFLKAHAVMSRSWVLGKILACHQHGEEGKRRARTL